MRGHGEVTMKGPIPMRTNQQNASNKLHQHEEAKVAAMIDELFALCARYSLHYAFVHDPDDPSKLGILLAHSKFVKSMPYMEMYGEVERPPKVLQ